MPALAQDFDFSYNGLLFRGQTKYALNDITGIDMPEVNLLVTDRAGQHGAFTSGLFYKPRTVTMTGRVASTDKTTLYADLQALKAAFSPSAGDIPLYFRLPTAGTNLLYAKPQSLRYNTDAVALATGNVPFIATLVCGDPRIYSDTVNASSLTVNPPAPGLVFGLGGLAFPWLFGGTPTLGASLVNAGNTAAPVIVRVDGPTTNPLVKNLTTGDYLSLNLTLTTSESLVVSTSDLTVLVNGQSRYSTLVPGSEFLSAAPGSNDFYAYSSSTSNGPVTVYFRSASF